MLHNQQSQREKQMPTQSQQRDELLFPIVAMLHLALNDKQGMYCDDKRKLLDSLIDYKFNH